MKRIAQLPLLLVLAVACQQPGPPAPPAAEPAATSAPEYALVIHGGAGTLRKSISEQDEVEYRQRLEEALRLGQQILADGGTSLDAVEQVVRQMEDDPLFNAGRGAVFTSEGTNELDAAIMDGRDRSCGSVSGLKTVKNPITLARRVMERSKHVFLVGAGAESFADEVGVERVPPEYFFVQRRYDQWQQAVERDRAAAAEPETGSADDGQGRKGTVGAVALDRHGNLAAATSTGGMTNKRFGRVGDVPVIGAGTYADNRSCAVSCTGFGEQYIRNTIARDMAALVEFGGLTPQQAADKLIHHTLNPGDGGLIAVCHDGSEIMALNTEGMFRGVADSQGRFEVHVWSDEE